MTLIERLAQREAELLASIPSPHPNKPPKPRGTRSSKELASRTWRKRVDLEAGIAKELRK